MILPFNKQLLDEVFVISGIIKVEVSVISQSRRLRLITLTEILTIKDITETESNIIVVRKEPELKLLLESMHCAQPTGYSQLPLLQTPSGPRFYVRNSESL